jgi:hypothetical protein
MQNIHVKRYQGKHDWAGWIEPEDNSWIVFIATDGQATFWRRTEMRTEDGRIDHAYIDAEIPTGLVSSDRELVAQGGEQQEDLIDYTVEPTDEHGGGFFAKLNVRAVWCFGATEHEAVKSLMNYVARLCVGGSLDHTGRRVEGTNERRYRAAWGSESLDSDASGPIT